jgi:hypothetical protein
LWRDAMVATVVPQEPAPSTVTFIMREPY